MAYRIEFERTAEKEATARIPKFGHACRKSATILTIHGSDAALSNLRVVVLLALGREIYSVSIASGGAAQWTIL